MARSSPANSCCISACSDSGERGPSRSKVIDFPRLVIRGLTPTEFVPRSSHYARCAGGPDPLPSPSEGGMIPGEEMKVTRRGLGAVLLLVWLGAMALLGSAAEAAPA